MVELKAKCRDCKKAPRNCTCFEFRLEWPSGGEGPLALLYVDNVATDPVRGQEARIWQPRRNAKEWRSPTYVDGYGPVMRITDGDIARGIEASIKNGTFFLMDYKDVEGCNVRDFDRSLIRRLPFLRRARQRAAANVEG